MKATKRCIRRPRSNEISVYDYGIISVHIAKSDFIKFMS